MQTTITREDRVRERDKHREIMQRINSSSEDIVTIEADKTQKRLTSLKERVIQLHDKKQELLGQPCTKNEFIQIVKGKIDSHRRNFIDFIIGPHLKECRKTNASPFDDKSMRVSVLPENKVWMLFAFAIRDEDIEAMIDELIDNEGISAKERNAEIQKIDGEIESLVRQIENERAKALSG